MAKAISFEIVLILIGIATFSIRFGKLSTITVGILIETSTISIAIVTVSVAIGAISIITPEISIVTARIPIGTGAITVVISYFLIFASRKWDVVSIMVFRLICVLQM